MPFPGPRLRVEATSEQSSLIELGVREGRFRDTREALEHALAAWVRREQGRLELLTEIAVRDEPPRDADAMIESGDDLAQFVAGVERRGLARISHDKSVKL